MFDHSSFDRRFAASQRSHRRMEIFMKLWFAFVAILVLSIFGAVGYTFYSVLTQPEIVGEFAGRMVSGFEGTR